MVRRVLFRLAAVLFALAGTLLVLEVVLQTASKVLDPGGLGKGRIPVDGEVRISCVGESTTFGKWPGQLEEILNQRQNGRDIRVINRGVVGIRTDDVAGKIEQWLDEDQPHLVITMLGINDEGNVLVYPRGDTGPRLLERLKAPQLLVLLGRSAFGIGVPTGSGDESPRGDGHLDDQIRSEIERLQNLRPETMQRFRYSEMIGIQRELITADPGTPVYHLALLKELALHHDRPQRIDEFFANEVGIEPSGLNDEERQREIILWMERTGDRFAGLKLATSIARSANDTGHEGQLIEDATEEEEIAGLAWLRRADLASRNHRQNLVRRYLLNADEALPDDYQWSLLLGDISFMFEVYDVAAVQFHRALVLRPDLPTSHQLVWLGRLANACEQSGEAARAESYRAQRDELDLSRFREFTRFYYQRVVDTVRAREIPVLAMQYPLLPVESLRKLLDYREDLSYLENRTNFETALLEAKYGELFEDNFAGSFGHLSPRGNQLVAENVADALAELMPELGLQGTDLPNAVNKSP